MKKHRLFRVGLLMTLLALLLVPSFSLTAQDRNDRDGDGIPNDSDRCPDEPGPSISGGCPLPSTPDPDPGPGEPPPVNNDRDGDGIPNDSDRCPDAGGHIRNNGCPEGLSPVNPAPEGTRLPAVPAIVLPTLPENRCVAATLATTWVNIRSIPSTSGDIVGTMNPASIYPINGQIINSSGEQWWRIANGWVAAWVVRAGQDCEGVPSVRLEPDARLEFGDTLTGAFEPEDPDSTQWVFIPAPTFEEVADLPVFTVVCNETVFVSMVGNLELPPNPCNFTFPNGLGVVLDEQGMMLLHENEPLGKVGFEEGSDDDSSPWGNLIVGYKDDPEDDDPLPKMTLIGGWNDAQDDGSDMTFIMHDFEEVDEPGGGLLLMHKVPPPEDSNLGELISEEEWNNMKGGWDGTFMFNLNDTLEMESCAEDALLCLTLLVVQPPDDPDQPDLGSLADALSNIVPSDPENPFGGVLSGIQVNCSSVMVLEPNTSLLTGSNCQNETGLGTLFAGGTSIGLAAAQNPDGSLVSNAQMWVVNCAIEGVPAVELLMEYKPFSSFVIHGWGWGCTVSGLSINLGGITST